MRKNCSTCEHGFMDMEQPLREPCITCIALSRGGAPSHWEASEYYRPDTNADRIRAMSDEELADVVANGVGCVLKAPHCMGVDCTLCILKWLRQPAKED